MNVFLSYSWKDRRIAKRLYDDLKNSGVKIWRDQIDGDPLADFKTEFLHKIDECQYFILLDSSNYRDVNRPKSEEHWCLEEVKRCLENQNSSQSSRRIIVCLLEKDGSWRKQFPNDDFKKAFEKVNALKYINLYYEGYDNSGIYDQALNQICKELKTSYARWTAIPTLQDLKDELGIGEANRLHLDEDAKLNIIVRGYEILHSKIERHFPNVRESFKVWIEDCRHCEAQLFFPEWTYAVWLVNQPQCDGDEACRCFEKLAKEYPNDPRGYRGWGNVLAFQAEQSFKQQNTELSRQYYQQSLRILLKTEELLLKPENLHQRKICMFGVRVNIGLVYYCLDSHQQALKYWQSALSLMLEERRFHNDLVECLCVVRNCLHHDLRDVLNWLQSLRKVYPLEPVIYKQLGILYSRLQQWTDAIEMMEKACDLQPDDENLELLTRCRQHAR